MAIHPEDLSRAALERLQDERLSSLAATLAGNPFQAARLAAARVSAAELRSRADLLRLPMTTKAELLADQAAHPPYGTNHGQPLGRFSRLHQTSGTSGQPLRWLDTAASWTALLDTWASIFRIVGLRPGEDRLFFPFSFGPFLGFWSAFEAATRAGFLCLPGGGLGSSARLRMLADNAVDVVFCTPTYALRLAEVAAAEGFDLAGSSVRAVIVAGEPGGSIPATRQRIETAWGARLFDHNGMTEVGPVGIECPANPGGVHVLEADHFVEVLDPQTGQSVAPGTQGELVLTTLSRRDCPLLRYRTSDLVCVDPRPCACGRSLVRFDRGVLGRVDDMIVLRGNNVHPSALQTILHRFPEVAEFRIEVDRRAALAELRIDVELADGSADDALARIEQAIRGELLFRAEVCAVAPGTLPRPDMKAQRLVRKTDGGRASGQAS
jgi:phenylacetate-CoA ligase